MLNNHVQDQLPFYVNDTLTQAERVSVELHLKNCEACRAELAEWQTIAVAVQNRATATTLPSLKLPPPSSAHRRIVSIVDYDEEPKSMNTHAIPMRRIPLPRYGLSAMIAAGLIVVFAIGLIFQGFTPEPVPQNPRQVTPATVYDFLKEDGRFTKFVAALEENEWTMALLTGPDPVTVFAVPDEWFDEKLAAVINTLESPSPEMTTLVKRLFLISHLVEGEWTNAELRELESLEISFEEDGANLSGTIYLAVGPSGRTVLEGKGYIVEADMRAGNGIVHVLEAPLTSPEYDVFPQTVYEWLKADGRFSIFLSMVDADKALFSKLNSPFSDALFVPTDAAFEAYFGRELDEFPFIAYSREVVQAHLVREQYDVAALESLGTEGDLVPIGNGESRLYVTQQEGRLLLNGEGITTPIEILEADVPVSHGLVHVIDTPLLPADYFPEETLAATSTVYELLQAIPHISEFAGAIAANDWTADVTRDEVVTVFAIQNEQFEAAQAGILNAQLTVDVDLMENFLFNHIVHFALTPEKLVEWGDALSSWSRDTYSYRNTVYVQDDANGVVRLNGQAHIVESIAATNGFIHIIDVPVVSVASLVQATDTTDSSSTIPTIYDVISADPRFSHFKSYVDRLGQDSWLWHTLTSPTLGKSTLFVPTDDALRGTSITIPPGEDGYEQMVMAYLADGLWSQDSLAVQGTIHSTWEPDGQTLTTTIHAEWSRTDPDSLIINNQARVIEGDIIAGNGIIHVIDAPLNVEIIFGDES